MASRPAHALRSALAGVLVAVAVGGCGDGGTAADLDALLSAVPAEAVQRGLFISIEDGFGVSLPRSGIVDVLGVTPEAVRATADTGGDPLTVLVGDIRPGAVESAAQASGYGSRQEGAWTVLGHDGPAPSAAVAAMPAIAVRAGALVVGSADEIAALVDGVAPAASIGWVDRIADALPPGVRAVAFGGPPEALATAVGAGGEDAASLLERAATTLPTYEGYALVWRAAEAVADDEDGVIMLARPPGAASPEDAAALALRAATGPLLGEGRRSAADLLDGGAPRVDRDTGVVRLPVRWLVAAPRDLRADVEAHRLTFLAPSTSG